MTPKNTKNVCEEQVFKSLFDKHAKSLHNYLYYKFGAGHDIEDTVQDAFIKLWEKCKDVHLEKAKGFLFRVATNNLLNKIKHNKVVLSYSKNPKKSYTVESPEFVLEEKQYLDRYKRALEKLTEGQRVAFLLNRIEGKKHKEIAVLLNISTKAVEKRIYGALKSLRKEIEELK